MGNSPSSGPKEVPVLRQESPDVERISVGPAEISAGTPCIRADWHAVHIGKRLKAGLGRPLVSPTFSLPGIPEARLMIFPDANNTLEGLRGAKKQTKFIKMLASGPMHCALKLKMPSTDVPKIQFFLTVGSTGPGCAR